MLARQLGQIVGRDGRGVGEGLVEEMHELGHEIDGVRSHDELVVLGLEVARDEPGIGQLVEALALEPDRKGLDGIGGHLAHDRDDRARVEPAAQEHAEGDVGDEAVAHGLLQELGQALDVVRDGLGAPAGRLRRGLRAPIRFDGDVSAPGDQAVAGLELLHRGEDRPRPRDVVVREVVVQGLAIDLPRDAIGEERFELGAEYQPIAQRRVVERLDAEPVTDEHEGLSRLVPQRDGEHSPEVMDEVRTVLLVEMDDRFRIGIGGETVPAGLQIRSELPIIVDLAVEDDPDRPILVRNRLMAAGDVDDAEPAHPEAHGAVHVDAFVVGTPVNDGLTHRPDDSRLDLLVPVVIELSGDAAHVEVIFFPK